MGVNNAKLSANILTIDDARDKYKDYQYAVVNVLDGMPVWLCKTIEDAKETIEDWQPYWWTPLSIVDLRKNEE